MTFLIFFGCERIPALPLIVAMICDTVMVVHFL